MRARIIIAIVACVAALGIAGCGGDDDETTSTTSSTTTPTATGATGAEGSDTSDDPEGTADVQSLLETAFVASGLTDSEAACVAEIVAPQVSGEAIEDVQDPAYVEGLLQDSEDEINECEGQ